MKAELVRFEAKLDDIQAFADLLEVVVGTQATAVELPDSSDGVQLGSVRASSLRLSRAALRERSYSATLSAAYAAFESFTEDLIEGYVGAVAEVARAYTDVPSALVESHSEVTRFALRNLHWQRVSGRTSETELVRNWNACLEAAGSVALNSVAYALHDKNLRTAELDAMFARVAIPNALSTVLSAADYRQAVENYVNGAAVSHASFDDFVERRNEVAHGDSPTTLLSTEYMVALVEIVRTFGRSLHAACRAAVMELFVAVRALPLGKPRMSIKQHRVVVLDLCDVRVAIGDLMVVLASSGVVEIVTVEGVQVAGHDLDEFDTRGLVEPTGCGLAVSHEVRKSCRLFLVPAAFAQDPSWHRASAF